MIEERLTQAGALAFAVFLAFTASGAHAQAPAMLPVQGYLTNAAGAPIDGDTAITFSIYGAETGGTPLHTETQTVRVERGLFTAYIGDAAALDLAIFRDDGTTWLGLRVESDAEMTPRFAFGTVPYAAYAQHAASVPWSGISGVPASIADGDSDTTYTAGSGLALAGTTFSIDTATAQARVTGTCPAGQSIRAISATGSVTCEVDDDTDTTYTAGAGLSSSGTTFSVDTSAIQARVSGTCAVGSAIRSISPTGTVTCEALSTGDITGVIAGQGLSGGGTSGTISLEGTASSFGTGGSLALDATCRNMASAVVSAPGAGWVEVRYQTRPSLAGTSVNATAYVGTSATDCSMAASEGLPALTTVPGASTLSGVSRFRVAAAGTSTYFLNATGQATGGGSFALMIGGSISAIFIPD